MNKIIITRALSLLSLTALSVAAVAQDSPLVVHLWANGAPGFESRKDEPEQAKDYWVKNINNPSITVYFPPKDKANGTAVVICPGGGHRLLVYNSEGVEPAKYLNNLGITAVILKYRLGREPNSPYSIDIHPRQDAYRAMRTVRLHAKDWGIDPNRVGIMGFSAGGEVVAAVAYDPGLGDPKATDPVDQQNGRPNFQILVYPGPLGVPATVPPDAPPAFMVVANDDSCCSAPVVSLLEKYRAARVPVEVHIFSKGNHAFNMGYRSKLQTLKSWPQRLTDWLEDNGWLAPAVAK